MGLTLLLELEKAINQFEKVYVLNRGRKYWDGKSQEIFDAGSGKFVHIKANRGDEAQYTEALASIFEAHQKVECLIDFCAYKQKDFKPVSEALEAAPGKLRQYIYISTDSVYEIIEPEKSADGVKESVSDGMKPLAELA